MFILAQIFGFLAWLCLLISYYRKNTNKILFLHIFSIVFYLLNYLFLGAWSGLFIIVLELIRDSLYYKTDKDNLIFLTTIPFYILLFVFAWGDYIEIIPIVASLFEGFTLTKKKSIIVPGAIIVYSMWIIYDLNVASYSGVLTDVLIVLSNIGILINMIQGFKETKNFKISSRFSLSLNSLNKMVELKKDIYAKDILLSNSYEEKLYNKNKDNFMFIKNKNELKGYITTIHVSKETKNKILNITELKDNYENIILDSNKGKIVIIDSIVLKEKYQNKTTEHLIIKTIYKLTKLHKNILIIASTEFEKDIANSLSFNIVKKLSDNSIIYEYKGN